ncbi:hypothetical protein HPB50_015722 [Hyalomma asiaticum]|uniref:Uncharacterized protein n=1 Tax=Hyalomma asiaticum TaxID=266040 RepID=A0ACB7SWS1_HYAAI|nr:hypothetical protein HPB50_015722 [Hyalomma asiaticum]
MSLCVFIPVHGEMHGTREETTSRCMHASILEGKAVDNSGCPAFDIHEYWCQLRSAARRSARVSGPALAAVAPLVCIPAASRSPAGVDVRMLGACAGVRVRAQLDCE